MAAVRETEETVNSGSEIKSGNETNPGPKSRDGTETTSDQLKPGGETKPAAAIKTESAAAVLSSSAEPSKAGADSESSLGKTLAAARERRGVSRADVVAETRIPAHYLEMIESSDYSLISDQLYLMPFLRRYAAFLNLDGEEVAMRFVREVQRAEVAAVPRMSEPLAMHDRKRAPWGRVAAVIVVLSAIVVLYIIASEHHRGEFGVHQSSPPAVPSASGGAIPPADVAPAPMAAPAPMTAPAPMAAPAPQAPAPARLPETSVVGGPTAPAAKRVGKAPPSRATTPADSMNE
jgi:cytoskeletal protein RodZ